ncbi:MAG: RdgB/HAM1 family non-canonical purine NTP pyrophosphatase [Ruminococcus sp.]|jgi:XTP/dITP diphosphohydrolase|nr:RdgB/HAM1 family non-canonical purine NTP pyrophosphatase [Ruminococcus sp.]
MIVIATNNSGKLSEYRSILSEFGQQIMSLKEAGIISQPDEAGKTLEDNAVIKARAAYVLLGKPVVSDDSGLFVRALGGYPGIYSARWGENDTERISRILDEMKDNRDRYAEFRAVICYIDTLGREHLFDGSVSGEITTSPKGENGFGYDPIFLHNGLTLAEMTDAEKNKISHRARALEEFKNFLTKA